MMSETCVSGSRWKVFLQITMFTWLFTCTRIWHQSKYSAILIRLQYASNTLLTLKISASHTIKHLKLYQTIWELQNLHTHFFYLKHVADLPIRGCRLQENTLGEMGELEGIIFLLGWYPRIRCGQKSLEILMDASHG